MSQSNECDPTENEVEYATVDLQKLRFIGESKTQTRMDIEDVLSDARVLESKIENFYRYRGKVKEDAASTQYHNEQMRIQHTQMIAKQIRKRVDEIQEAGKDLRSDFQNLQANKCIPVSSSAVDND